MAASPAPSLAAARRAFARAHVCAAARDLFFAHGYAATTLEQIARAAGTRRTTLYSHFADKAEILRAIGEDYHRGLCAVVATLPGPAPDAAEIAAWFVRLVAFVKAERAPATLLIGLGVGQDTPPVVAEVSRGFMDALAERLPAFARAGDPAPAAAPVRARAKLILRELSLGCLAAARDEPDGDALLAVVAELLETFARDHA